MTTTNELPDYKGEHVSRAVIKITGAGTGMDEGLGVAPIVLDLDDEAYFIVRAKCAESPSHYRDKNELLIRRHRLHVEDMAPIDAETGQKALAEYADLVAQRKAEAAGQMQLSADEDLEGKHVLAELNEGNGLSPEFKGK